MYKENNKIRKRMKEIEKDYHGNAIVKPDYVFILKTIVGKTIHICYI